MNMVPKSTTGSLDELDHKLQNEHWEKSLSMPNLIGWRRKQEGSQGLYEYKSMLNNASDCAFYLSTIDVLGSELLSILHLFLFAVYCKFSDVSARSFYLSQVCNFF